MNTDLQTWLESSKIKDVVYHGTDADFLEFEPKLGRDRQTAQQLDFGSHFTEDLEYAKLYSKKGRIIRAHILLEHPLDLTIGGNWMAYRDDPYFHALQGIYAALKFQPIGDNYYDKDGVKRDSVQSYHVNQFMLDSKPPAKVRAALLDAGFDGVIYEPYVFNSAYKTTQRKPRSFIVLDKSQVRMERVNEATAVETRHPAVEHVARRMNDVYGKEPKYTQGQCANLAFAVYLFLEEAGTHGDVCSDARGEHWWVQAGRAKLDADFWDRYDAPVAVRLTDIAVEDYLENNQDFIDEYNVLLTPRKVNELKKELLASWDQASH